MRARRAGGGTQDSPAGAQEKERGRGGGEGGKTKREGTHRLDSCWRTTGIELVNAFVRTTYEWSWGGWSR